MRTNKYKYLGKIIEQDLTHGAHVENQLKKQKEPTNN